MATTAFIKNAAATQPHSKINPLKKIGVLLENINKSIDAWETRRENRRMTLGLIRTQGSQAKNIGTETYENIFPSLFRQALENGASFGQIYRAVKKNGIVDCEASELLKCGEFESISEADYEVFWLGVGRKQMFLKMLVEAAAEATPKKIYAASDFAIDKGADPYEIVSYLSGKRTVGCVGFFTDLSPNMLNSVLAKARDMKNSVLERELVAAIGQKKDLPLHEELITIEERTSLLM